MFSLGKQGEFTKNRCNSRIWRVFVNSRMVFPAKHSESRTKNTPFFRRLFVTCGVFTRYFFVTFSWFFRGFFVAPVLGKFYAYSPSRTSFLYSEGKRGPKHKEFGGSRVPFGGAWSGEGGFLPKFSMFMPFTPLPKFSMFMPFTPLRA